MTGSDTFRRIALGLAWLAVSAAPGSSARAAAPYSLADTELRELPRSANGHTYLLYVNLPPGYATGPARRYPVVYFPDGYWDFGLIAPVLGNLRVDGAAPPVIVVGVGYAGAAPDYDALRAVDLTPGVDPWFAAGGRASGGADAFLAVLANEIIPFVEREYRVDPGYRVLVGNSFGGLFAAYAALARPGLFQACVACSPALWWRSNDVARLESAYAAEHTTLPLRLYFGYGTEDDSSITGATQALYRQMQSRRYEGLVLALREMDGERHSSLKPDAYTRGLRFALAPLAPRPALTGTSAPSNLINISTRGFVGTGDAVLIAGFVVRGFEPKRILVRAAGPALLDYQVTGVLLDPQVAVHAESGASVGGNDNWSATTEITTAFQQAGAFAFRAGSRDAATVLTLAPGSYTAVVSGVDGATGNAEVEVYELPNG